VRKKNILIPIGYRRLGGAAYLSAIRSQKISFSFEADFLSDGKSFESIPKK